MSLQSLDTLSLLISAMEALATAAHEAAHSSATGSAHATAAATSTACALSAAAGGAGVTVAAELAVGRVSRVSENGGGNGASTAHVGGTAGTISNSAGRMSGEGAASYSQSTLAAGPGSSNSLASTPRHSAKALLNGSSLRVGVVAAMVHGLWRACLSAVGGMMCR